MHFTRPTSALLRLTLAAVVMATGVLSVFVSAHSPAAGSALRFVIEDGYDVTGDGLGEYVDFRLLANPNDSTDVNYCMETQTSSLTFLFFNRNLDALGGAGVDLCDDIVPRRQFILRIEHADACAELASHNYGWPDGTGGCFMNGYRNPRMRIDKLMASRPRTTPIDFLIGRNPDNSIDEPTYRIESDGEAAVVVNGATRSIAYGGSSGQTFRLVRVGGSTPSAKGKPGPAPAWATPFVMTLSILFTVDTGGQ